MTAIPTATARVLTPRGRGAVATIVVSATDGGFDESQLDSLDRLFAAANGKSLAQQPNSRVVFGHWGTESPHEELVVCRDVGSIEIHCHGGSVCVNRILTDLANAGFPSHSLTEPTLESELQKAITFAPTLRTAKLLLTQQRLWPKWMQSLRTIDSIEQLQGEFERVLAWTDFGLHLTEPWRIAIVGEPNVGKSTLLNALLGFERSIVFDQPGTTRDAVSARTVFDGWPVLLSDTAGIRESDDAIEVAGVAVAISRAEAADLRIHVSDLSATETAPLELVGSTMTVGNKCDLVSTGAVHTVDHEVSAATGDGLPELIAAIGSAIVPELPNDQQCVPVSNWLVQRLEEAHRLCSTGEISAVQDQVRAWAF